MAQVEMYRTAEVVHETVVGVARDSARFASAGVANRHERARGGGIVVDCVKT